MTRVFLAAEAGQPPSEAVRQARARAERLAWASPTLRAHEGRTSRAVLEAAAASVAAAVAAPGAQVTFFPGAAVALAQAVAQLGRADLPASTCAADRQAIVDAVGRRNAALGVERAPLGVDSLGRVRLAEVAQACRPGELGVLALGLGNAEVGTLAPLAEVHRIVGAADTLLLVDATMAAGRMLLPADWDALVVNADSWAGGEAVAAVVVRPGVTWRAADGSGVGTDVAQLPYLAPSVPACAAAARGLEIVLSGLHERSQADFALIDSLREALASIPDVVVHGDPVQRLPHVLGFSLLYIDAEALLLELDRAGVAVASGSACAARSGQPSHVLAAMGTLTSGNVRVTLPIDTESADIAALVAHLGPIVARMRTEAGL